MRRGWLASIGMVVAVGCAHGPPTSTSETPQFEHVFQKPLPEAMAVARQVLEERGYAFEPQTDPTQLATVWQSPEAVRSGNTTYSRYLVTGISVAPRQSVVRIFRVVGNTLGNDVEGQEVWWKTLRERREVPGKNRFATGFDSEVPPEANDRLSELRGAQRGHRDSTLEQELTVRLESLPSIEVLSGNVTDTPRPQAVRKDDFYLARWNAPAEEAGQCGEPVRGAKDLGVPGLTLIIGEQLGSVEGPAVVGNLVCQLAESSVPVVLGLSLPSTEQQRIDRYLASPGAPADQDALLEGRFWTRPYQDGRSSRAVLDLIDRVRALRASGLLISLVAYDTDVLRGSERDTALAQVWRKRREASPTEMHVILAGNAHTRTVTGTPWDRDFVPMAHHLKDDPRLVVLEMAYAQGTRWGCDVDSAQRLVCGVVGATPSGIYAVQAGQTPFVRRLDSATGEGIQGLLFVGALSVSYPAVDGTKKDLTPPSPIRVPTGGHKAPPMF